MLYKPIRACYSQSLPVNGTAGQPDVARPVFSTWRSAKCLYGLVYLPAWILPNQIHHVMLVTR